MELGTADVSPGAPQDEVLQLFGIDEEGRIALQVGSTSKTSTPRSPNSTPRTPDSRISHPRAPLENAASRADDRLITLFGDNRLDEIGALFSEDTRLDDRRQGLRRESNDRATAVADVRAIAALGVKPSRRSLSPCGAIVSASATCGSRNMTRGPRRSASKRCEITEIDADGRMVANVDFDPDDIDAAFEELDARYLAGEAAADAHTWSVIARARATLNRHELPPTTPDWVNLDHRRGIAFAARRHDRIHPCRIGISSKTSAPTSRQCIG